MEYFTQSSEKGRASKTESAIAFSQWTLKLLKTASQMDFTAQSFSFQNFAFLM
jgi:hypothetical protein